uniref:2-oxoglutarate and iron dependent oxygenase domain containing 3 n=1 Tax=Anas platyrhynchos platyrhynchos TaxID=8840 RepID=A0A493T2Y2_ANAPP
DASHQIRSTKAPSSLRRRPAGGKARAGGTAPGRGWTLRGAAPGAALLGSAVLVGGLLGWSLPGGLQGGAEVLARGSEAVRDRFVEVACSGDYGAGRRFEGCTPRKCGRGVTDAVITREEAERIRSSEEAVKLNEGGCRRIEKGASLFKWGLYAVSTFSVLCCVLCSDVRRRIQEKIAQTFGISSSAMYLTKPTFFSRINSTEAKTTHDEYWHPHIDKVTYGSFDYTSLLYLSDYAEDFGGGRFVFMDEGSNKTIEPRTGRVSFFTSGSENLHRVEKVRWGTRYAVTISFTCNPDHGIGDPVLT